MASRPSARCANRYRSVRLLFLCPASKSDEGYEEDVCAALSTGLGPAIGALVAMFIFKRKTEYTLLGKSAWKSIATIVIPCIVWGIIGGWDFGVTCFLTQLFPNLPSYPLTQL